MSSNPAATLRHRNNAMPAPGTGQAEDIRGAAEQFASKIPPHHTLTSLSITHVQFAQDDILSKLFAYVTLSPLAILCGYVGVIITSRDLKPAVMLAGQLANELVNLILKRLVKQARPTGMVSRINCMTRPFGATTTSSLSNRNCFGVTRLVLS
jgi:dolichyldiphosphatase